MRCSTLLCVLAGVGCGQKDEPAPRPSTVVTFLSTDARLRGATIILDGKRETMGGPRGGYSTSIEVMKVLPLGPPVVDVELATPCGPVHAALSMKLETDEQPTERVPHGRKEIKISLAAAGLSPALEAPAIEVLVDSAQPVQVGKLALKQGEQSVAGFTCAPTQDVMVGGKVVGAVDSSSDPTQSVFIGEAGACYVSELATYGYDGGTKTDLSGSQVYRVPHIDYFMIGVPNTMRGEGHNRITALNKVPCGS